MDPPLPNLYGRDENRSAPDWLTVRVDAIRATQPKIWAEGKTPIAAGAHGGKIIIAGDGR